MNLYKNRSFCSVKIHKRIEKFTNENVLGKVLKRKPVWKIIDKKYKTKKVIRKSRTSLGRDNR